MVFVKEKKNLWENEVINFRLSCTLISSCVSQDHIIYKLYITLRSNWRNGHLTKTCPSFSNHVDNIVLVYNDKYWQCHMKKIYNILNIITIKLSDLYVNTTYLFWNVMLLRYLISIKIKIKYNFKEDIEIIYLY